MASPTATMSPEWCRFTTTKILDSGYPSRSHSSSVRLVLLSAGIVSCVTSTMRSAASNAASVRSLMWCSQSITTLKCARRWLMIACDDAASSISATSARSDAGSTHTPPSVADSTDINRSWSIRSIFETRSPRSYAGFRLRNTRTSPPPTTKSASAARRVGWLAASPYARLTATLVVPSPPLALNTAMTRPRCTSVPARRTSRSMAAARSVGSGGVTRNS